jgi:hypothetical protein
MEKSGPFYVIAIVSTTTNTVALPIRQWMSAHRRVRYGPGLCGEDNTFENAHIPVQRKSVQKKEGYVA